MKSAAREAPFAPGGGCTRTPRRILRTSTSATRPGRVGRSADRRLEGSTVRHRVLDIPLWLGEPDHAVTRRAAEKLGVPARALSDLVVLRRSLDARKKGHPRWL